MTVKLWAVDRLHLRFDYHSESIHSLFQLFVQNFVYFFIFLLMKLTHIQVFIKKSMKLEYIYFFYLQADPVLSFDVLYVQIFI